MSCGSKFIKDGFELVNRFSGLKKIAVFGCGIIGKEIAPVLEAYSLFDGFIDNDKTKQEEGWNGCKVWSVDEYLADVTGKYIVVAANANNTKEIEKSLATRGLIKGKTFTDASTFMQYEFPLLSYYGYNKLFINLAQICLTERCTLKCSKCAHACNKVPMTEPDMSFDEIKLGADCFFLNIDVVREFVLIGGEPLLSKELKRSIEYIGSNYRDKIITFAITTNGTIVPDQEMIELCKKYNVIFRVSDYSKTNPRLKDIYRKLYDAIGEVGSIIWDTNDTDSWFDYGFGDVDNGNDPKKLVRVFDQCRTPCREVRGDKYYYCVMARSVAQNSGRSIGVDEFFDLSGNVDRDELLKYEMGDIPNGYLSMCRYCRGNDAHKYLIPAAVQDGKEK